jgi:hypothetical protein
MLNDLLVNLRVWTIRPFRLAANVTAAEPSSGRFLGAPHSVRERIRHPPGQFGDGP